MNKYTLLLLPVLILACSAQSRLPITANTPATGVSVDPTSTDMPETATVCHAGILRFRTNAGTSYAELTALPDGAIVTLLSGRETTEDGAKWRETENGWVNSKYICEDK